MILFILLLGVLEPAFAQDTRYRVEIVVLRLLEQSEPPLERGELTDYSSAVDFLTPAPEEEQDDKEPGGQDTEAGSIPDGTAEIDTAGEASGEMAAGEPAEPDPNRLVNITEMSSVMQEAWRRLRLSGPYRPEQYLSWEQGSQPPFPTLRIHDLETVKIDDPWADYRQPSEPEDENPASSEGTTAVFGDAAGLNALNVSEQLTSFQIEGPQLPDPVYYYRLDGTANLMRSRFLHLSLDLQLRQPIQNPAAAGEPGDFTSVSIQDQPSLFQVYEIKQARQVRTGRMEYFDGPVLGVLAYITEVIEQAENELDQ